MSTLTLRFDEVTYLDGAPVHSDDSVVVRGEIMEIRSLYLETLRGGRTVLMARVRPEGTDIPADFPAATLGIHLKEG